MKSVKPWNKKEYDIFHRVSQIGRADFHDIDLSRSIGRHYQDLINDGYLEIARVDKKKKTIILPGENVRIIPQKGKFNFYKIF